MNTKHLKAAGAAVSLLIASGPALASVLWSRVSAGTGLARRGVGSRSRASGVVVLLAVLAVLAGSSPAAAFVIPGDDPPPNHCLSGTSANFWASANRIVVGQSVTLDWSVIPPSGCNVIVTLDGQSAYTASRVFWPTRDTTWKLTLYSSGAWSDLTVSVAVDPVVTVENGRSTVRIDWDTQVDHFIEAIGKPDTTVLLADDLNLDLSGHSGLYIESGVHIIGGRSSTKPGPRLFTKTTSPIRLFVMGTDLPSDNVRISGIRLDGGNMGIGDWDQEYPVGITVTSSVNVEIANSEIYGWSGVGVQVHDDSDRLNRENASAVRIHDNYIHHNRNWRKLGYGVSTVAGAYALIDRNVFDYNRHALEAAGTDGTGYLAYNNLLLSKGGENFDYWLGTQYTHQFDVHGSAKDSLGRDAYAGQAGEYFDYRHNTLTYTADDVLKVRGKPTIGADVTRNVFAKSDVDSAVSQTYGDNLKQWDNTFGLNAMGTAGRCDFDGDEVDDHFFATGATWWYKSNATGVGGWGNWVFLNTSTKRLKDLAWGDVNGDGRCDVTTRDGQLTYLNGTGKPLQGTDLLWQHQTSRNNFILWHLENGMITWQENQQALTNWQYLGSGDFDGDGAADTLWRSNDASLNGVFYMKNGTGVPAGPPPASVFRDGSLGSVDSTYVLQATGDFDHDGISDILWRRANGHLEIWPRGKGLNNPVTPTWQNEGNAAPPSWQIKGVGDFNGDGYSDILWRNTDGAVDIWLMNGDRYIGDGTLAWGADPSWTIAGVGDFDSDGRSDILWRHADGGAAIWLKGSDVGATDVTYNNVPGSKPGLDWAIEGVSDFNRDGRSDILWRQTTGQTAVWIMNGIRYAGELYPGVMDTTYQLRSVLAVSGDRTVADIGAGGGSTLAIAGPVE